MSDSSILLTLAEIAVAFAGFSAIVVSFKRRDAGQWAAGDADRFHGMVLHAMAAVFFCMLPSILGVFADAPAWGLASGLLGMQIAVHIGLILWFSRSAGAARLGLLLGVAVVALQLLNVLGLGFAQDFGPYLIGVLWHVFQSGVLFVWLIWIPASDIRSV